MNDTARIEALEKRVAELETCLTKWAHVVGYMDPGLAKLLGAKPTRGGAVDPSLDTAPTPGVGS